LLATSQWQKLTRQNPDHNLDKHLISFLPPPSLSLCTQKPFFSLSAQLAGRATTTLVTGCQLQDGRPVKGFLSADICTFSLAAEPPPPIPQAEEGTGINSKNHFFISWNNKQQVIFPAAGDSFFFAYIIVALK